MDKMQISKRVVHSDTHRERSQSERNHSDRNHSERSQSGRTLCLSARRAARFRLGGCADVRMGKKENEIQSNQPILTFLNRTIPNSHSKIFENDWLDWIGWFKLKLKNG